MSFMVAAELYKIILAPLNTEKINYSSERYNRLAFKVATWANKHQIKQAIEQLFKVSVEQVATLNIKGKQRMFKQRRGKKSDWKKAIVKLAKGQDLKMADFVAQ